MIGVAPTSIDGPAPSAPSGYGYRPERLIGQVAAMEAGFPDHTCYHPEMMIMDSSDTAALLREISRCSARELDLAAYTIAESKLETLLMAVVALDNEALRDRIIRVLKIRMKKRHAAFAWQMLQHHVGSVILTDLLISLKCRYYAAGGPEFLALLPIAAPDADQVLENLLREIQVRRITLAELLQLYAVNPQSPLGIRLGGRYFVSCTAAEFATNVDLLAFLVQTDEIDVLPVINHYIRTVEPNQLADRVCSNILQRNSRIDDTEFPWSVLDDVCSLRFMQWLNLYSLRRYFQGNAKKMAIFEPLYADIFSVLVDPQGRSAFIYFKTFIIVDLRQAPDLSFVYTKGLFSSTYSRWSFGGNDDPGIWPLDLNLVQKVRTAVLTGNLDRSYTQTLAEQFVKGSFTGIIQLQYTDALLLYSRKLLNELIQTEKNLRQ